MSEPFPIFVTRWWQSSGIEEATALPYPTNDVWCVVATGRMKGSILQAGDWHLTRGAAAKEAERRRQASIRATREKLEGLEALSFEEKADVVAEPVG